jgi:hypothetical protein
MELKGRHGNERNRREGIEGMGGIEGKVLMGRD